MNGSRLSARALMTLALVAVALVGKAPGAFGHSDGAEGAHNFDWHNAYVARAVGPSYSWNNLGRTVLTASGTSATVDGRACMRAGAIDIDVRDSFGFDIDEPVTLELTFARGPQPSGIQVLWDASGGPAQVDATIEGGEGLATTTLRLERAQFANRGDHGTDLMIAGAADPAPNAAPAWFTLCDVRISRSFATPAPEWGWVELSIRDERGRPAAARVGLYDESGRSPPPSDDAVAIARFDDRTRTYLLQSTAVWPHANRWVFYVDGTYRARVPAGEYRLIAAHGIEYRITDLPLDVQPGETESATVRMRRFADMPERGWRSGDVHIHNARPSRTADAALLAQTSAEDVHIANILRMGNVSRTYFEQYAWGEAGRRRRDSHVLVPGQEDPRTSVLGHTIHLNLEGPVRFPEDYLDYPRLFQDVAERGGLSGFAHASGFVGGTEEGMAIVAALGLLDFSEVMQASMAGTGLWFDLLNLGLRSAPAAGTDYPYIEHPGAVRGYVRTGDQAQAKAWFDGLERGETFVTNGPLLSFAINDAPMGGEVRVARGDALHIEGSAELNPDLGELVALEVIRHGESLIRREGPDENLVELDERATADTSAWYVLRAVGRREGHTATIEAVSAPIYVIVDDDPRVWKRAAVAGIVARLDARLAQVLALEAPVPDAEAWDTAPEWTREFERRLDGAREGIEAARARLAALAAEAIE